VLLKFLNFAKQVGGSVAPASGNVPHLRLSFRLIFPAAAVQFGLSAAGKEMLVRVLFLITLILAAAAETGITRAADEISRIPRVGFKTVMRIAAGGLCGRIADALVAREKINVAEGDTVEAVLIVWPIKLEVFPKRIASVSELLERLSANPGPCAENPPSGETAALVYEREPDGSVLRVLKYDLVGCANWQGGVFCRGPILLPGYLEVEFVRGSTRSSLEQLQRAFGLAPTVSARAHLSPEQERIFKQDPDSTLLPADFFDRYQFEVGPRHEEPWAFILNRLPYIESAARLPQEVAAVDAMRIFAADEELNRLPRSPLTNAAIPSSNAQTRSLSFLREWFEKRGGILTLIKQDDDRLLVRVDHLRSEIIRQENFWEYLKLNLILIEDQKQTTLYLINDGYYAAGLGARLPPDTSFTAIEHDYFSDLTQYTEALATQIQDHLKGPP
jgi:hypothetical protein